jgi:hypothetical protein
VWYVALTQSMQKISAIKIKVNLMTLWEENLGNSLIVTFVMTKKYFATYVNIFLIQFNYVNMSSLLKCGRCL